ncbi:ESX-1 secretion-associated protein [Mycobacterium sp. NPDC048908]|uniref:ESX-1 secretion-associated protein n=1 Tax=Mycobacterium sp. NPDC048908 TaxID=3364292 RepID=UPI003715AD4A
MSGDELRVVTAHLDQLAVVQGRAAVGIRSATEMTDGADRMVRQTHGAIASASARALTAVLAARRNAGTRMAAVSEGLSDKLSAAAKRYDTADQATSGTLRDQMQSRQI